MIKLLTADISSKMTGLAFTRPGSDAPGFSSFSLPDFDGGRRLALFEEKLCDAFEAVEPTHFAFEAALVKVDRAAYLLIGLANIAELVAYRYGVSYPRCQKVRAQTARKHFTGRGDATKDEVERMCRTLGWQPKNQDESDAGCIFGYEMARLDPKWALTATPLLARSAA